MLSNLVGLRALICAGSRLHITPIYISTPWTSEPPGATRDFSQQSSARCAAAFARTLPTAANLIVNDLAATHCPVLRYRSRRQAQFHTSTICAMRSAAISQ